MANCNYYNAFEKPMQHFGLNDWKSKKIQICNLAESHQKNGFNLRQSSRNLRNESLLNAHFNTLSVNGRLSNR